MASHEGSKIFQWNFSMLNHTSFHPYSRPLLLLLIFFTILIFITSLSLCVHCRRLYSRTAAATTPSTATPASGLHSAGSINALPIVLKYSSVNNKETECSICLGVFQDEEKVKVLPACNHAYHSECVDKWLSSQSNCPLCRASFSPINGPST